MIQIDQQLQQFIASFRLPILDVIAQFLEITGDNVLLYTIVIVLLLCIKRTRKYAIYFAVTIIIAILMTTLIKHSVQRPRPFVEQNLSWMLSVVRLSDHYLSFPSGHTTAMTVVATTYWLYYRKHAVLCVLAVIIMAWSRIYLSMHYPLDTLVGMTIGIAVSVLMYVLIQRVDLKILKKNGRK